MKSVEEAYAEMKKRGWGFARNKRGSPNNYWMIGPMKDGVVQVYSIENDPIMAVQKAIEKEEAMKKVEKISSVSIKTHGLDIEFKPMEAP